MILDLIVSMIFEFFMIFDLIVSMIFEFIKLIPMVCAGKIFLLAKLPLKM